MYARFRLYGGIVVLVMAVCCLVAYGISSVLQKTISQPILALADTAKAISERKDYTVSAPKVGEDELGLLTDAFNQMLYQIHERTPTCGKAKLARGQFWNRHWTASSASITRDVSSNSIPPRNECLVTLASR